MNRMNHAPKPGAILFAKDPDLLADFYRQLLDCPLARPDADHLVLETGGLELIVHAIPPQIAREITITCPPAVRDETPVKLLFGVADLAHAREVAARCGGRLHPADREWQAGAVRVCDGHDPEGNVFQLRQTAP